MLQKLLDFIWPRKCAVCSGASDRPGRYICSDCLMRLPFTPVDGLCSCCGRDAPGVEGGFLCSECMEPPRPNFDRVGNVFRFEGHMREMISAYKFRGALHLRDDFVDFLEAYAKVRFRIEEIACVLPMPSSFSNRFWRGYNQCEYLAKPLSQRLSLPYCSRALRRTGLFRRQAELSGEERRINVKGTFAVTRKGEEVIKNLPPGKAILLLDDIMTTGSTLSECAKTLKAAGAQEVWCITLARPAMQ